MCSVSNIYIHTYIYEEKLETICFVSTTLTGKCIKIGVLDYIFYCLGIVGLCSSFKVCHYNSDLP